MYLKRHLIFVVGDIENRTIIVKFGKQHLPFGVFASNVVRKEIAIISADFQQCFLSIGIVVFRPETIEPFFEFLVQLFAELQPSRIAHRRSGDGQLGYFCIFDGDVGFQRTVASDGPAVGKHLSCDDAGVAKFVEHLVPSVLIGAGVIAIILADQRQLLRKQFAGVARSRIFAYTPQLSPYFAETFPVFFPQPVFVAVRQLAIGTDGLNELADQLHFQVVGKLDVVDEFEQQINTAILVVMALFCHIQYDLRLEGAADLQLGFVLVIRLLLTQQREIRNGGVYGAGILEIAAQQTQNQAYWHLAVVERAKGKIDDQIIYLLAELSLPY